MVEAPKGKGFRELNFAPVIALLKDEPIKILDLMQQALDKAGEIHTTSLYGTNYSAFYDPRTKIMHTDLPYIIRVLCPFGDRHIGGIACEVCGEIEKVKEEKEKAVFLDGYGYIYWGEEKLGFIKSIFQSGGLLNTAKEAMTKALKKLEDEGGKASLEDVRRIYEDLPGDYK